MGFKSKKVSKIKPGSHSSDNEYFKMIMYHVQRENSISNPSLDSHISIIEEEEVIEKTPSFLLGDNLRNQIYEKFLKDNNITEEDISLSCIQQLTKIFQLLDEDRFNYCKQYIKHIEFFDNTFMNKFETLSANNSVLYCPGSTNHNLEYRAILHTIFVLRIKSIIFYLFLEGSYDKLSEIINLVTLSHVIMGVTAFDFKVNSLTHLKYLLTFDLITHEELGNMIYYSEITEKLFQKFILYNMERGEVEEYYDNPARKNYRALKEWRIIVKNLMHVVKEDIKMLDKYVYEMRTEEESKHVEDEERCCLIRWLKKGYKYKAINTRKTVFKKS